MVDTPSPCTSKRSAAQPNGHCWSSLYVTWSLLIHHGQCLSPSTKTTNVPVRTRLSIPMKLVCHSPQLFVFLSFALRPCRLFAQIDAFFRAETAKGDLIGITGTNCNLLGPSEPEGLPRWGAAPETGPEESRCAAPEEVGLLFLRRGGATEGQGEKSHGKAAALRGPRPEK